MNQINKLFDWFRAQRSQIKSRQGGLLFLRLIHPIQI